MVVFLLLLLLLLVSLYQVFCPRFFSLCSFLSEFYFLNNNFQCNPLNAHHFRISLDEHSSIHNNYNTHAHAHPVNTICACFIRFFNAMFEAKKVFTFGTNSTNTFHFNSLPLIEVQYSHICHSFPCRFLYVFVRPKSLCHSEKMGK